MKLSKANGKDVLVLSDPIFRVNMMKRGKIVYFWRFCFNKRHI